MKTTWNLVLAKQGPEVRVAGTDKGVNYWALSNMVNYNTGHITGRTT